MVLVSEQAQYEKHDTQERWNQRRPTAIVRVLKPVAGQPDCGQQNPHDERYRRHVWPPRAKSRGIVGIECATCYLERGGSSPLLHELKRRRIAAFQSVNSLDARNFRHGYWLDRDRPCPPNGSTPRTTPGS